MCRRWSLRKNTIILAILLGLNLAVPSVVYAKGPSSEPKGWDEGKKEGWKGSQTPPGLTKAEQEQAKAKSKQKVKKEEKKENKQATLHEKEGEAK